jgi:hypothetical protein
MKFFATMLVAALSGITACSSVFGQEFVNYRGPTGNGIFPGVGLLKEWPAEGPPLLWKFAPGLGWAAPAMVDGKVYLVGGVAGQLWVLDTNGRMLERIHVGAMDWKRYAGSRGVPLVKDGMAVVNAPNADYWGLEGAEMNKRCVGHRDTDERTP